MRPEWSITTPEGRRAWAFIAIWIGCFIFTLFAALGVWLVSKNELYTLILALAAHVQLLIGMGTFSFILGRRMSIEVTRQGAKVSDAGAAAGAQIATNAATGAAQAVTDTLSGHPPGPAAPPSIPPVPAQEGDVTEKDPTR